MHSIYYPISNLRPKNLSLADVPVKWNHSILVEQIFLKLFVSMKPESLASMIVCE